MFGKLALLAVVFMYIAHAARDVLMPTQRSPHGFGQGNGSKTLPRQSIIKPSAHSAHSTQVRQFSLCSITMETVSWLRDHRGCHLYHHVL